MIDVAIIGGGHNGLVCAGYLAKAGLEVCVLERRGVLGGAAATEEFHPGFRNSVASYTVSLLNPRVIEELELSAHGLSIIERPIPNFWPLGTEPGAHLTLSYDLEETQAAVARLSPADADALPDYYETIERGADMLRAFILETPPNLGGGFADIVRAMRTGDRLRRFGAADQTLLLDLFTKSAAEFLGRWFRHPSVLGAFAFDGVVGNYASPYTPGTAYVLLHHMFGEVNGKRGRWGHAVGGMGAITQAMARAAEAHGATLRTGCPVAKIVTENGAAVGIELASGEIIRARRIAANVNPKLLFSELVDEAAQPADFHRRMRNYACGSGTFRMNVALTALPSFSCRAGAGDHLSAGVIIGPDLDYLERAYLDARAHGCSKRPVIEMLIPSTIDASLAPEGAHVASLFCQHVEPSGPGGRPWDEAREEIADLMIDTVTEYAPNFRDAVVARRILSPLDLEREFGLTGGDIFHGRLSLDQLFSARPAPGHADYRMPLRGLYLCGSGAHPGGGVTGAPGRNAAMEILKDARRRR